MIDIPKIPDSAKVPKFDYIEELTKIKQDVQSITIDGPSGIYFQRAIIKILQVLIEVL